MHGSVPLLDRFTHERACNLACLKLSLGQLVESDNVVCYGFAGHLLPRSITHVLRVCLVASLSYRLQLAATEGQLRTKEAKRRIRESDQDRTRWTLFLYGQEDPFHKDLYDTVLPMHSTTREEAIETISDFAGRPQVRSRPESLQAVQDFILSAEVSRVLAENGYEVSVTCSNGNVKLTLERYVLRFTHYKETLEDLVSRVAGVKKVHVTPGTQFVPPSLTRDIELELPSKVLLIDDEREFVHTLSERLQTRKLESSVVYDGESALSSIQADEPEVIVLDLKMPGIDGLEVLRRVKRDHPSIEVIILTGHGSTREEALAKELGAFAYLQKPVDVDQLAQLMKEAYRKLQSTGSLPPEDE